MSRLRLSRKARADLDEIWLYLARQQSLEAADHLIDSITERFSLLASTPDMGPKTRRSRFRCPQLSGRQLRYLLSADEGRTSYLPRARRRP